MPPALYWFLGYILAGVFMTLVVNAIVELEGDDLSADCLTGINLLWPMVLPDLLFRLVTGRWFRRPRLRTWPPATPYKEFYNGNHDLSRTGPLTGVTPPALATGGQIIVGEDHVSISSRK